MAPEAAIDANAPLEDDDEANAGPIDSEEETTAMMSALKTWNPQPLVPQPVLMPVKRRYQLERLKEQLDNATSGGTVNIFKVVTKNGNPLLGDDVPGGERMEDDAPGEADYGNGNGFATGSGISGGGGGGSRRPSSSVQFGGQQQQPQQRRPSQASKA